MGLASWLNPVTAVAEVVSKPVTTWLQNKGEIKKAEHKRDLAVIENQARLASDKQSNNSEWELASLRDKDRWLRRFSFVLFTSPVVIAVATPDYWAHVVVQLDTVPDWMLQIWFYMIAGIWGIAELKNSVPSIIQGIRKNNK